MQSAKEIFDLICRTEKKHDLFQHELDGWCVWGILRPQIAWTLSAKAFSSPHKSHTFGKIQRLVLALRDLRKLIFMPKVRAVAITYTSGLAEKEKDRYKDIWFDDLLMECGSYIKIENINNPDFASRRPSALIQSYITTDILLLIQKFLAFFYKTPKEVEYLSNNLAGTLQKEFEENTLSAHWIEESLTNFLQLKMIYTWMLKRIQPECVVVASPGEYSIVAAAKEQGIKVVELQHGINNKDHCGYSWPETASRYRSKLPLADRVFLYGEYWAKEMNGSGFWGNDLKAVGCPRIDQYRKKRERIKQDTQCSILFTTQGIDTEKVIRFFTDFMELAVRHPSFHLNFKLHPIYDKDKTRYVNAFKDNPSVHIFLATEGPSTFELLVEAKFHISISSAVHYDALGLGIPTIILPFSLHEIVLPLYVAGHAFLAESPSKLLEYILKNRTIQIPKEVSDYYFHHDSVQNMKREIDALIGLPAQVSAKGDTA